MKNKIKLFTLLASSSLLLSGCSLFNDDDLAYTNTYNTISPSPTSNPDAVVAGGVEATEVKAVPNALCFKDISYAENETIKNTYGDIEYQINDGDDYSANKSSNNYDLYVPESASRSDKHTVILFIHGGAWVSGFKTDVNQYVYEFANRGYVTATIKYTLLKRSMDDPTLSIFRNLDEIDACIKSIKSVLKELGFDTSKSELVIGGASSGAHLSMLYSYSRGDKCPLPIKFVVDAVGPVDIKPDSWKSFKSETEEVLEAGISAAAIDAQIAADNLDELAIAGEEGEDANWNTYQTIRIANGMCGMPYSLAEVEAAKLDGGAVDMTSDVAQSMTKANGGQDLLSVTSYIGITNSYPIITAYAGKDRIVGINQFATLERVLISRSIEYESFYFKNCDHAEIDAAHDKTNYDAFVNKVDEWCKK